MGDHPGIDFVDWIVAWYAEPSVRQEANVSSHTNLISPASVSIFTEQDVPCHSYADRAHTGWKLFEGTYFTQQVQGPFQVLQIIQIDIREVDFPQGYSSTLIFEVSAHDRIFMGGFQEIGLCLV